MQIPCFIHSSILTPYVRILSNDLDFSKLNFVTKIPNFRFSKGPDKKCFLIRELQMRKLFHWHYVFTQTWYLVQELQWALPKMFVRCDEIMRRDEIRWFDGTKLKCFSLFINFKKMHTIKGKSSESRSEFLTNYNFPWLGHINKVQIVQFRG